MDDSHFLVAGPVAAIGRAKADLIRIDDRQRTLTAEHDKLNQMGWWRRFTQGEGKRYKEIPGLLAAIDIERLNAKYSAQVNLRVVESGLQAGDPYLAAVRRWALAT